ncbi:IclR family transcriptional regulator [Granulosicoccus antarcticus]|uniref:HTH-type transcriptional repressor AllR n=1 Tax=Granulosicoccus antarcticus IMCC3135 TaxID=1192854 RepID=A0A2Z2NT57_9GAMM|nr:IclR family transcriptional regulator [Granulosicoccus antarcticus]ASJ71930.1 Pectin degradation repressor protein KdgR [Granulosicoccus antarcticus IMCC3135]
MSSAAKTLELLALFSKSQPEIGLSQLCRLAHRDKTTTYRHLQALEEVGFVEQNPLTKRYRLGPVVLQLAQTRESTVPRKMGAEAALVELANATSETSHVSVLSGTYIYPLTSRESPRYSTRVIIDLQKYPLHATASGLCALAFGPSELIDVALKNMEAFTPFTLKTAEELKHAVVGAQETGFGYTNRSFDEGVLSIATPVFDQTGLFAGSVSVASVATRFTPELEHCILEHLIIASREITHNWGGTTPENIELIWAKKLSNFQIADTTA